MGKKHVRGRRRKEGSVYLGSDGGVSSFKRRALARFGRCQWCNRPLTYATATADHVRPVALGGPDCPSNLALSCRPCNLARGAAWREGAAPKYGPANWLEVL